MSASVSPPASVGAIRSLSLQQFWEIYIKAVKSQDQSADNVEKQSMLLNALLHLCVVEMKKGSLLNFSDMRSTCSQLSKEFMSDILHITSRCDDDDVTQLQKYLLEGRGWILLEVMHRRGVQAISGCRELADLLVSLLPWCLKFPLKLSEDKELDLSTHCALPQICTCFQNVFKSTSISLGQTVHRPETLSMQSDKPFSEPHARTTIEIDSVKRKYYRHKSNDSKDDSKSSLDSSDQHDKLQTKFRRKFKYYTSHFYNRPIDQMGDSESEDDDIVALITNLQVNNSHRTTGFELCILIIDMIYDLCMDDVSCKQHGKLISPSVLPNLLQCLTSLDYTNNLELAWENEAYFVIKRHLLRTLFLCCGVTANQNKGTDILSGQRVIEKLLTLSFNTNIDKIGSDVDLVMYEKAGREILLMSDIVIGTVLCLTVMFENLPFNLSFIKKAVFLIKEFNDHKGFEMLQICIMYSDWLKLQSPASVGSSARLEDDPIQVFGVFMNTLKTVRVNYVHSMKCVKRKHYKCSYSQYFDHHHDILGVAAMSKTTVSSERFLLVSKSPKQLPHMSSISSHPGSDIMCLVSSCTLFLIELLDKVRAKSSQVDLIRTIYTFGLCCCMDLESIISAFVSGLPKFSPAVRKYAADVLNNIFLKHFSGGISDFKGDTPSVACTVCENDASQDCEQRGSCMLFRGHLADMHSTEGLGPDSGVDTSDVNKETSFDKVPKWRAITQLKPLLYSKDETLSVCVAKHLMALAIKSNSRLKAELFFDLFLDALDPITQEKTTETNSKISKSVQVHCLSSYPYLLQVNCVTEVFLCEKGVAKLCVLLEDVALRAPILRIFEAVVAMVEQSLNKTFIDTDGQCPTDGQLIIDAFIMELSKRSFGDNNMYHDDTEEVKGKLRIRRDSCVLDRFSLPALVDIWETCAQLCLHSQIFVVQFRKWLCLQKTETLLLDTLDVVLNPELIAHLQSQNSQEADDSGMEGDSVIEIDKKEQDGFFMRLSLLETLLIVLGAGYKYDNLKVYTQLRALQRVRERFLQPMKVEPSKLRAILDAVMNAAMPQFASLPANFHSKNISPVDDDADDDDEVLLQSGTDEDNGILTEIGYDADSEQTNHSDKEKQGNCCKISTSPPYRVFFPNTFALLFDLLVLLHQQNNTEPVINWVLHKLLQNIKMDVYLVKALCEQDVLSIILSVKGFWKCLLQYDEEREIQETFLALIEQLATHRLEADNLKMFLLLFQQSDFPVDKLLAIFLKIVESSQITSHHSITFPASACETLEDYRADLLESGTHEALTDNVSPLIKKMSSLLMPNVPKIGAESCPEQQQKQHVWTLCALKMALKEAISWPPVQIGLTLAMWLCLERSNKPTNILKQFSADKDATIRQDKEEEECVNTGYLHVASIGTRMKLLEVWAEIQTGSVLFRLTSEVTETGLVLKEKKLCGVLTHGKWQHVVFSYLEKLDGSTIAGHVNLVIDGWHNFSIILDHPSSAMSARCKGYALKPHICIGHVHQNPSYYDTGTWNLAQFMLFKSAPLPKELCFHLYSLGPNCRSIVKCDTGNEGSSYAPHLTRHTVVQSRIQYDVLVGCKKVDLTDLRYSLVLSYLANRPKELTEYLPVSRSLQGQIIGNNGFTSDALLSQQSKVVTAVCQGYLYSNTSASLEKAIEENGGIAAILFLTAKVFEKSVDMPHSKAERLQAEAVQAVISVMHHSSCLHEEYINICGYRLLCKVLTSSRSLPSQHLLKVLMDGATTESVYRLTSESPVMTLKSQTDAVIQDVSIIEYLVLYWLIWDNCDNAVIELLFAGLAALVRDDHPHLNFNVKQYQAIGIVNRIFKIYQERIQEGKSSWSPSVSASVVTIIENMMGSPPDLALVEEICDFLLQVHPAANTYINHSRSSFYFTLPWGLPPSPLTKWKLGLGNGDNIVTSTPHKTSFRTTEKVTEVEARDNYPDSSITKIRSSHSYPDIEAADNVHKKVSEKSTDENKHMQSNSRKTESTTTKKQEDNLNNILHTEEHFQHVNETDKEGLKESSYGEKSIKIFDIQKLDMHISETLIQDLEKLYKKRDSPDESDSTFDNIMDSLTNSITSDIMDSTTELLAQNLSDGNDEMINREQGLIALCVGLLNLLSSVILTMPDMHIEATFQTDIINAETLIVFAQNSSVEVRTAVIRAIAAYLERGASTHVDTFMKIEGFSLLAAQLFQYPTCHEHLEAAISIVMQRPFRIDEGLHENEAVEDLGRVQQAAIPLMLSLLGKSMGDLALCHNTLQFCSKLFNASDVIATVMIEHGVVEMLATMLHDLLKYQSRPTDVEGMDENEILRGDLMNFFQIIAVREFSVSGPQHYQLFEDIIMLLQDMESTELQTQGFDELSVLTLRTFQYHILLAVVDLVENASDELGSQQVQSFFSKPQVSSNYVNPVHQRTATLLSQPHFPSNGHFGNLPFVKQLSDGYPTRADQPYGDVPATIGGVSGNNSGTTSIQLVNFAQGPLVSKPVFTMHGGNRVARSNSLLQTFFSIGKRKKLATVPISQNELIERLKKVVTLMVDTAIFADCNLDDKHKRKHVVSLLDPLLSSLNVDKEFLRKLFLFAYRAFEYTLPQDKTYQKRNKNVIMWGAKDVLRVQLGHLLAFMLSDKQEFEQRVFAFSFILGERRGMEVFKMIVTTPDLGNDFGYYMYQILTSGRSLLSKQLRDDGSKFINHLSSAGFEVFSACTELSAVDQERLAERKNLIEIKYTSQKSLWLKKRENSLNRIFHKYDRHASFLTDTAMEVTQTVTQLQVRHRNIFIIYIKQKKMESIQVKKQWQEIVQNLTHKRALWYDEKSYPQSWQLNPTEGPCRVRKRLQRGHLGIPPKFLKKEAQYKLAAETVEPPLMYLFEDDHSMSDSAALIYQLHKNNNIRFTSTCRTVTPFGESVGELLIGEDSVFFVADEAISDANYTQVLLGNKDQIAMTWPFEYVLEIHKRWYELTDTGLEIFLTIGKTCMLAFKSTKERDDLFGHLMMIELPNRRDEGNLLDIVDLWQNGKITNFEYLTKLNKRAGRSFNDLMQYPIMPFILSDYTSSTIDLRDISVYRDLSKPVAVQNVLNEQKFKTTYDILKAEYEKYGREGMTGLRVAPYHYGSHYSNSATVMHFLVRLPPFTKMFLSFQDQSFDIPDRTFHNLHTSWRLSSAESNTDVKELIPEFFCAHEFLVNSEGFNFGKRQNGEQVDDVVLPPWCDGNPRIFMLVHRQALESEYVTENIFSWIDLIFGYKQRGEAAVKAINVFHPATYYGLDVSCVKNVLDRKAIQTMVRTYGQTPKQLFTIAHPRQQIEINKPEIKNTKLLGFKTVSGLKWGSYLGSPDRPEPEAVWNETFVSQVTNLVYMHVPPANGTMFGIGTQSCLIVQYNDKKQKGREPAVSSISESSPGVVWLGLLTWRQMDGLVYINRVFDGLNNNPNKSHVNFIQYNLADKITCCVCVPDCRHLFFGGTSGVISIYNIKHNPAKESGLQVFGPRTCLYGHAGAINTLVVCQPYSVMVSASQDGTCIIWDLNRLSYVRSITGHKNGVQVLAISDTLGDIASVSRKGLCSQLHLHTVNAKFVTMTTCPETINCLAYSTAAEGVSINVIAGGLSSGVIRMWSSWDLTAIRDLEHTLFFKTPICSIAFTKDSQRLYASSINGIVILWDNSPQSKSRSHKFKHLPFMQSEH